MKALHLNLAAEPYRDYRPVYGVAAVLLALSVILMLYNGQTAYQYLVETKETRAEIARVEEQTAAERRTAEALDQSLKRVNVPALNAETSFINNEILERSFSWSNLLDQLERVVPGDVRLLSLSPAVSKDGTIKLTMQCVSKSQDGMIRFLNRLFSDPHFVGAFPQSQQVMQGGLHGFSLNVAYDPNAKGDGR